MRIGDLSTRIKILNPTVVDDGLRGTLVYTEIATVWSRVVYASDAVRWRANAPANTTILRVTIRKPSFELTHKTRLRIDDVDYDVDGIKPLVDEPWFWEITAIKRG